MGGLLAVTGRERGSGSGAVFELLLVGEGKEGSRELDGLVDEVKGQAVVSDLEEAAVGAGLFDHVFGLLLPLLITIFQERRKIYFQNTHLSLSLSLSLRQLATNS